MNFSDEKKAMFFPHVFSGKNDKRKFKQEFGDPGGMEDVQVPMKVSGIKHRLFRRICAGMLRELTKQLTSSARTKAWTEAKLLKKEWEDPTLCGTADGSFRNPPFTHQLILGKYLIIYRVSIHVQVVGLGFLNYQHYFLNLCLVFWLDGKAGKAQEIMDNFM